MNYVIKRLLLLSLFMVGVTVYAQEVNGGCKYTPHYYERLAQFASEPPVSPYNIVMLGNSLTENGGDWNARLGKKNIVNRGIIGDEVMGVYDRLGEFINGHPKKIFLMIGVNDISHGLSVDSIVGMIDKVIGEIKDKSPKTKIYLQSLLPFNENFHRYRLLDGKSSMVSQINASLVEIAKNRNIRFINLYPFFSVPGTMMLRPELSTDGLHLNEVGYNLWIKHIKRYF